MTDIFLSYNREDAAVARLYADGFAREGLSVWWDATLHSGEAYDEVTEAALREAKAVVVLWSPRSVVSRWVRAEATIADRRKTLVPVTIEPCERPIMFELTQTAELSHWTGDAEDDSWLAFLSDVNRFIAKGGPVAPVIIPSAPAVATAAPFGRLHGKRSFVTVGTGSPAPNDLPKVAVLPFDDLSPDSNVGYFSDGVSEEILATLSRGSDIRTIGKLSSFQFRGSDKARAGRELAATHVLDGSVRREGDRVRITAHLYDTQSGEALWSESFEGALRELIDTQMTIAEAIAGKLRQRFTSRPSQAISPESYDLYLKAKSSEFAYAQQSAALGMLERVTRDAPDFAPAWGLMASTLAHLRLTRPFVEWPALTDQARQAISRARSIDPLEPSALIAEVRLLSPYGDYEVREALLAKMQQVMGNTSAYHFLQAWCLGSVGRLKDAICEAKLSRELDPMRRSVLDFYGVSLYNGGRLAEAREVLLEDHNLAPDNHYTAITLLLCAALLGDRALVDQLLDPERLARYPLRDMEKLVPIAHIELNGDASLASSMATALRQKVLARGCFDALSAEHIARYSTPAECHDLISSLPFGPTGEDASDFVSTNTIYLLLPDWPDVRRDRRFPNLCARLGLAQFWTDRDVWPDCADESGLDYDFRSAMREAAESIAVEPPPLLGVHSVR
ncbi:MAG TPA: TIR domain-containing protein [Novosphingobium sp.]|nr:TIR domain-containing protein [Novosphingobium sp.]